MKWLWNASNSQKSNNIAEPGNACCILTAKAPQHSRTRYIRLFCLGALLYLAAVLPFIIYRGGIFFYYGDYNVQQVPFYILAHRSVRNGTLFWNFNIDLGSSTGGSYAFYLWGSPFFWISCLFPEKCLPYLLPILMSMKYGTALCTSHAWLRRNLQTDRGALIGALLYSFSGFAACNIVFQHFHEAIAFFPLYLLMLDLAHEHFAVAPSSVRSAKGFTAGCSSADRSAAEYPSAICSAADHIADRKSSAADHIADRKRSVISGVLFFALATAGMSVVNYFFFYGQVLFLVLYYLLRYACSQSLRCTIREILELVLSGILGLCLSAFFLIQVWDCVSGNSRLSDLLTGYRCWHIRNPQHRSPSSRQCSFCRIWWAAARCLPVRKSATALFPSMFPAMRSRELSPSFIPGAASEEIGESTCC